MADEFKQFYLPPNLPPDSSFLQRGADTFLKQGELKSPNYVQNKQGWKVDSRGNAEFRKLTLGNENIYLSDGQGISGAITDLTNSGGGILTLGAGTYTLNQNITVPNATKIVGTNRDTSILEMGSYQFIVAGTSVYTTGTISSVSGGGFTVTGSSTAWLANASAGQHIFIDNRWYAIAAVGSDTSITLAEPYKDAATFSGNYRIATVASDIIFENLTVQNSSTTAIDIDDAHNIDIRNCSFLLNNKGFTINNYTFITIDTVSVSASTSNGYEISSGQFCNCFSVASVSNGGHGILMNTAIRGGFSLCAANGNTGDGVNMTDVDFYDFKIALIGNGGQGMEMVSGCDKNLLDLQVIANTSDGVKLTATSDQNRIMGIIQGNGGYGINIAASTCDNNTILAPVLGSNTSGDVNDSGTGTIRIQVSDTVSITDVADDADGALSITSGTTTINLQSQPFVVKHYSSISITGTTSKLAFSNPATNGTCVIFRVSGNVTVTSTNSPAIDASSLGQSGGAGGTGGSFVAGSTPSGTPNSIFDQLFSKSTMAGAGAAGGSTGASSNGAVPSFLYRTVSSSIFRSLTKAFQFNGVIGAGGGGGSSGTTSGGTATPGAGGAGGKGGGSLLIICGGDLNLTGAIDAKGGVGSNGGNGTAGSSNATGGGAGGGGGGGFVGILYSTATATSGTISTNGGAGGTGGNGATGSGSNISGGGAGQGSASIANAGGAGGNGGGAGSNGSAGTAGSGTNGGAGGTGGTGASGVGGGGGGGGGGEGFSFVTAI